MSTATIALVVALAVFIALLSWDLIRGRRRRRVRRLYFVPGPSMNGTKSALEQLGEEVDDTVFIWPPDRR